MAFDFDTPILRRGTDSIKWDSFPPEYLPMFVADSDFAVPQEITAALIARAEHPVYGYSRPNDALFEAFLGWHERTYGVRPDRDWLVLLPGIVPALAVASRLTEGKSLTVTPNYPMLLNAPERAGREMLTVPLRNDKERYYFDFDALQDALTEDTKLFYLCNPQNPVGRVYTRKELEEVSAFAEKNGLTVISDEIHCELVYDHAHTPFFSVSDYAREHSITLMAPGKTYNIPGVALAFAIIPNAALKEQFQKLGYAMGHPGIFETAAATAAYRDGGPWRDALVNYLRDNRDLLAHALARCFPKAKIPHTEGTYLQWVDFREYGLQNAGDFRERAKIIVNDGTQFGAAGYVRINFACTRATLTEALDRIEHAVRLGG